MVQVVPFRVSFWFRAAFEDGEEENTLSIVGQGDLMISCEPIELSSFIHPASRAELTRSWLYVTECMLPLECSKCQVCYSSSFHLPAYDLHTSP